MTQPRLIELPDPGDRAVCRYSRRSFPTYRYVPGLQPHPHRDPAGHSYEPHPSLNRHAPWRLEDWRALDEWLYGVDLFNCFYFWEAHEAWEGLWAATERDQPPSWLLQGLIQIAAALLKTHMQVLSGARTLSAEGLEKLRRAAGMSPRLLGLDLHDVDRLFSEYFLPLERNHLATIDQTVPTLTLEAVSS